MPVARSCSRAAIKVTYGMASVMLVPIAEYLNHTYHPDRDYLEGVSVERNVGEISHSDAQSSLLVFIRTRMHGFWAGVEVRVQVRGERFRIPDVTIMRGGKPEGRIIMRPPEAVVEVLSPDDRAADIQDKIDDYLAFGIPCVWVLRPETGNGWMHTNNGAREAKDGVLMTWGASELSGRRLVEIAKIRAEGTRPGWLLLARMMVGWWS